MDALKVIESFEALIQPIIALKPAIEQAKAAERALKDLDIRRARSEQELQAVDNRVKAKQSDLDNARVAHEKQLEQTRVQCVSMRTEAKTQADAIIKDARGIKELAESSLEQMKLEVSKAKDERDRLRVEAAKAKQELDALQKQREAALSALAKIVAGGK